VTAFVPPPSSSSVDVEGWSFIASAMVSVPAEIGVMDFSRQFTAISGYVLSRVPGVREPSDLLRTLLDRADDLERLPHFGRPAPTAVARAVASAVMGEAAIVQVTPDRVVATLDGGVMFYFLGGAGAGDAHNRYATFECHSGGELVMLRSDRGANDPPDVEQVEVSGAGLGRALKEIASFLGRSCHET
jgi:hypothetical protein